MGNPTEGLPTPPAETLLSAHYCWNPGLYGCVLLGLEGQAKSNDTHSHPHARGDIDGDDCKVRVRANQTGAKSTKSQQRGCHTRAQSTVGG